MIVRTNYFNKLINLKDKEIINWNASKSSYVYYNGIKCYKATLSF